MMTFHTQFRYFSAGPGTHFELHVVDDHGNYVRVDFAQVAVSLA